MEKRGRPRKDQPKGEPIPFSMEQSKEIEDLIKKCIK
jgi:hypothetical protein